MNPRPPVVRRGDLWLADVPGDKIRPVVILTRTAVIKHLHSVIAAPVTSTIRSIPSEVPLGISEGLLHESVANFDNIQLLPQTALIKKLGVLGEAKLRSSCAALARATDC